jgi:hypothetical protein
VAGLPATSSSNMARHEEEEEEEEGRVSFVLGV